MNSLICTILQLELHIFSSFFFSVYLGSECIILSYIFLFLFSMLASGMKWSDTGRFSSSLGQSADKRSTPCYKMAMYEQRTKAITDCELNIPLHEAKIVLNYLCYHICSQMDQTPNQIIKYMGLMFDLIQVYMLSADHTLLFMRGKKLRLKIATHIYKYMQ